MSGLCFDQEITKAKLIDYNFLASIKNDVPKDSILDFLDKFINVEAETVRIHHVHGDDFLKDLNQLVLRLIQHPRPSLVFVGKCTFANYKDATNAVKDLVDCIQSGECRLHEMYCHDPLEELSMDSCNPPFCPAGRGHWGCPPNCRHKAFDPKHEHITDVSDWGDESDGDSENSSDDEGNSSSSELESSDSEDLSEPEEKKAKMG